MQSFANEILCPEMSDQIFLFLIPTLSEEVSLACLLESLLKVSTHHGELLTTAHSLCVTASPWLLYSLLSFGEKQIGMLHACFLKDACTRKDRRGYLQSTRMISMPYASNSL